MDNFFATDFPITSTSEDWADRVVKQGHVDYCLANGHATWTEDGVDKGVCPRCGEVTRPAVKPGPDMEVPAMPFTGWEVPEGFETFDIVQRFDDKEYRFGCAHVYDDGDLRIVVRPGVRGLYVGGGFTVEIESMIGNPTQHFSNVNAALASARDEVLTQRQIRAARAAAAIS